MMGDERRTGWRAGFVLAALLLIICAAAWASQPDWDEAQTELTDLLQRLIRTDTVNPPGNEIAACKVLNAFFDGEGMHSEIYRKAKGRGNLLARLSGDGNQKPILLAAHTDVVPFDREEWSVSPLSGEIRDGYLYGRGALDDKGMLAVEAMAMALLKRQNVSLHRDVILLATADEEAGGESGMGWMLERHRSQLDAAFALNEGGRIVIKNGKPLYIGIQTSEKVAYNITLIARGTSGHASVPRQDNAIFELGRALVNLEALSAQPIFTPVTRTFFESLASFDPNVRWVDGQVATRDPLYLALLTNTISPTIISGGVKSNVLPATAEVNLNCRLLPGQDADDFVKSLRQAIGSGPYEFQYTPRAAPPPPSSTEGAGFILLEQVCRELFPGAPVLPYLSPGMSDATRLRRAGIPTYGLLPFPLDEDDAWRLHGKDERVSVEGLMVGLRLVYRLLALAGE